MAAPLKILQLYYEPAQSGQTAHVMSLVRGLPREHYHFTIAIPQQLWMAAAAFRQMGAEVAPLVLGKVIWPPASCLDLIRLLRRERFDLVHVHSQEAGMLGRLLGRLAGQMPILYTPQLFEIRRRHWHWLYLWLERRLASLTAVIFAMSESDRRRLVAWGFPANKVIVAPNGVELEPAGPATAEAMAVRRSWGATEAAPVVMQVGRLSAQKDPLAFLAGAALVAQARPDAHFVLVGEGPLQASLTAHIRELKLSGRVHLAGWRPDARRLMWAADVVTLTSRWEGLPFVLLEAMAAARPVVTTAVNGCVEIVVDGVTGFLTPPGDMVAWAGRVLEILNDPARAAAMGQAGRRRVAERYTVRHSVLAVEAVYRRLAQR